jgi:hypothetical protein
MDLIGHIKHNRAKQRQKKPFRRDAFNRISSIVRQYDLNESFLDLFDTVEDHLAPKKLNISRVRMKPPLISPLFSLVAEEEYHLTMSIIDKVDSPYLTFAHSPEEILLCEPLFRLNPELSPETLMRYHFESLFLHEHAKQNRIKQSGNETNG